MMEKVYNQLATRALQIHEGSVASSSPHHSRTLIALAGPPGSGKTTVAFEVVSQLNQALENGETAIALPMDGFHLTQAALQKMSDSEEAFARRGVHWTFDGDGVVKLVSALHDTRNDRSIIHLAPSFDHKVKDPVADALEIRPEIGIVIIEGNWLLFDEEPWSAISQMVDDTWFIGVDRELAKVRVAKRHIQSGIESTWDQALHRAETNDIVNGDLINAKLIEPKVRVQSIETPAT